MDALQSFLQSNGLATAAFPPDSRYHGLPTAQATLPDGRTVVHVTRRFLPPPERFTLLHTVAVMAGERHDQLAARHLGAAAQWWRLADANGATLPEAMAAAPGARLRITLPEGVPGAAPDGG